MKNLLFLEDLASQDHLHGDYATGTAIAPVIAYTHNQNSQMGRSRGRCNPCLSVSRFYH